MDCPLYISSSGEREGELKPYQCPVIYCPPKSNYSERRGNFTFSICVKYMDNLNPENKQFIEKTCESNYGLCSDSCDSLKGEYSWAYIFTENYNYTTLYAIGCREGDYSKVQNKSTIFPPSTIKLGAKSANPPTSSIASISYQTQMAFTVPWILTLILVVGFFTRRF